ncbi:hypothetical protein JCM11641_007595 [Rhodosporidiobolus odoratus]
MSASTVRSFCRSDVPSTSSLPPLPPLFPSSPSSSNDSATRPSFAMLAARPPLYSCTAGTEAWIWCSSSAQLYDRSEPRLFVAVVRQHRPPSGVAVGS